MATYFPIFISPLSNNFPPDTPGLGCHFPLTSDLSPTLIAQHPPSPLKPGQTPLLKTTKCALLSSPRASL